MFLGGWTTKSVKYMVQIDIAYGLVCVDGTKEAIWCKLSQKHFKDCFDKLNIWYKVILVSKACCT